MVRSFLLSLLGLALLTTEAATAQTLPADQVSSKKEIRQAARATRRAGRTLTNREKKAVAAQAAVAAKAAQVAAAAQATPDTGSTTWDGWSTSPMPAGDPITHRPTLNVSVAPGMPLNQIGHGVTTDYDGRPLRPATAAANTTLATGR